MPIVPFNPRDHGAFVYSAFCAGSGESRATLDRLLDVGSQVAVAVGTSDPTLYVGFAILAPPMNGPPDVAWCYVKPKARKNGLCRAMLSSLGVSINEPMTALFWSPMIPALRRRGFVILEPTNDRS